jgi:rare lipoprotein A
MLASYYGEGDGFDGQETANCTTFDKDGNTVAHNSLPFGTKLLLVNPSNNKHVTATVTDTGNFRKYGRDLDVSAGIARRLGFFRAGSATLKVRVTFKPQKPVYGDCLRVASKE